MSIVEASEAYVRQLLTEELHPDHRYHNLTHTLRVLAAVRQLCTYHSLTAPQRELLELVALFHDTGFTVCYQGHEQESQRIAAVFLAQHGYPAEHIGTIQCCIACTEPGKLPATHYEAIIKDADLSNLADDNYLEFLAALRYEWATFLNQSYSDQEWYTLNYEFLRQHTYCTEGARVFYDSARLAHQDQLRAKAEKLQKQANKAAKRDTRTGITINTNRSAQMMVKTSLRNHLDLSNLADNKANIMLSINALIITVAMPLGIGRAETYPYLGPPLLVLLATCLVSMIFATIATRPIKMSGRTTSDEIGTGRANLFFFGNFYRMTFDEYRLGLSQIIAQEEELENSIMRDLFFLGKSLGSKYARLRICYNVFLFGITLGITVGVVAYLVMSH